MSDARELSRGTAVSLVVRTLSLAAAVAIHLIIGRTYGSAALGIYALALVVAYTAAMLGRAGTDRAIVRFVSARTDDDAPGASEVVGRALSVTLPLSAALGLMLYAAAPFLAAHLFRDPDLATPLRALALSVPAFNLICALALGFQGLKRVGTWALVRDLLPNLVTLFALAGFAWLQWPADSARLAPAFSRALSFWIGGLLAIMLWLRAGGRLAFYSPRSAAVRSLLATSRPMLATASLYWVLGWADVLMLGVLGEASDVGIYRAAGNFATAVAFARPAVQSIAMPKIARAWADNERERLGRIARLAALAGFSLTALAALPVMLFAEPLLRLFGQEFAAGRGCLVLLCLAQLVPAVCGSAGYILDMTGEQKALRRAVLAAVALNLLLNALWIPGFGSTGAAAASLVSACLWNGLAAARARRTLGLWVGVGPVGTGPERAN